MSDREDPPHMENRSTTSPHPPVDPQLQNALAALLQAMTAQMQQGNANAHQATPAPRPSTAPTSRSRVKLRDPDPYDGSDPSKLRPFLSQCKLVFRTRPEDYRHDSIKINYAVSWLTGTAQRWYEPTLDLDEFELPLIATDWDAFEEALKTMFGEADPVASASHKLDNLTMKDHHHLNRYNVEFNEYATITGFDQKALYAKYYKGLAPRLKDALIYCGRPATLSALRTQAQALDLRYWERRDEERFKTSSTPLSKSSGSSFASTSSTKSPSTSSKPPSRSSTPSVSASREKKPDISKNLGTDGKLLPEEKRTP
jgi:hypothetical protein